MTTKPRRTITPAEKAQDALDVAERRAARAMTAQTKALGKRDELEAKYESAVKPLDDAIAKHGNDIAEATREVAAYRRLVEDLAAADGAQDPALPAVQTKDTYVEPTGDQS